MLSVSVGQLRYSRAALWGTITAVYFSLFFFYLFDRSISVQIETRDAVSASVPSPIIPSIVAAIGALFCAGLSIVTTRVLRIWLTPTAAPRSQTASIRDTYAALCVVVLAVVLTGSVALPQTSRISACRCCLFTVNAICRLPQDELPRAGFYDRTDGDGRHAGVYSISMKRFKNGRSPSETFENAPVHTERTRFGWPEKTITRDVAVDGGEWHVAFEGFYTGVDILESYSVWLVLQTIVAIAIKLISVSKTRRELR